MGSPKCSSPSSKGLLARCVLSQAERAQRSSLPTPTFTHTWSQIWLPCEATNLHVPRQDLLRSARVCVSAFTEELFGLFTRVDHIDRLTKEVRVDDVACVGICAISVTQDIGGMYDV